jgi:guanyl-specific ribonuclease Sa
VRRRCGAALTILVGCALALAACSTGKPTTPATSAAAPITTQAAPPTTVAPSSTSAAPTTPPPSTSHTATPTNHPSTPALPADYCTAQQLTVRILPGGAYQNYEIAGVTYTNASSTQCSLSGFPTARLLRADGTVLSTSKPAPGMTARLVHLAPGAQAEAQIRDHTTCQAPLPDSVEVTAPAPLQALRAHRPQLQMRGCTVTVDPIALSS